MKDQEFSRPREEFSPLREEFATPAAEFSLPKQEYHMTGPEVQQTASPLPEKKKKRINPLMLTTAAVVAAAVTLSSTSHSGLPPLYDLTPAHQTYLNAVSDALEQQDSDTLLTLALDDTLPALFSTEITAYNDLLMAKYDNFIAHTHVNDLNPIIYTTHNASFSFSGTSIGTVYSYREHLPVFSMDYQQGTDPDTGDIRVRNSAAFEMQEPHSLEDETTRFHTFRFRCYPNEDGTVDFWEMSKYLSTALPGQFEPLYREGTFVNYRNDNYTGPLLEIKEGTFAHETYVYEDGNTTTVTYLHDGTVTILRKAGTDWTEECVITVQGGHTLLNDSISLSTPSDDSRDYTCSVTFRDGVFYPLAFDEDAASEEDFLYHTFQVY